MSMEVLCAANAYNQKYYFNGDFSILPRQVQEELQILCVTFTEEVGGVFLLGFDEEGNLQISTEAAEEDALYEALQSGQIGGFAADVWWNAPKRGESESWPSTHNDVQNMENVVMSPHRAGFIEGSLPHLDGAIENISALIRGEPLQNLVDRSKAY